MKNFNPLVSIVIPVYNGANYLKEAINSALNQTYNNIEIIIINDGSTDAGLTEAIARGFGDKIRYFSKENGGCGSALNYGIEVMKGEYFSWLSHDDLYALNKVQSQIEHLNTLVNKNTIVYSGYELVNDQLVNKGTFLPHEYIGADKLNNSLMPVLQGLINGCTLLIPKKVFNEFGVFDNSRRTTQDYALWFDFFRTVPVSYLPKVLVKSRIHSDQDTQKLNELHLRECNQLWAEFMERLTTAEKISLFGSEYGFITGMAERLAKTPYDLVRKEAIDRARNAFNKYKISVIIFCNEKLDGIKLSLESLKHQTYTNFEVIIIHRGFIAEAELEEYRLIINGIDLKTYEVAENKSLHTFLYEASNYVGGLYAAFLNAGDRFLEVKLEKQLDFMLLNRAKISITLPPWRLGNPNLPAVLDFPKSVFEVTNNLSSVMVELSLLKRLGHQSPNLSPWVELLVFNEALICTGKFTELSQIRSTSIENLASLLQDKLSAIKSLSQPQYFYACNFLPREKVLQNDGFQMQHTQWQINAVTDYEEKLLEFWYPGEGYSETRFSMQNELRHIKSMLSKRFDRVLRRMRERLVWMSTLSYADYEGIVVRLIKPLIPMSVWKNATKMYRTARNKVIK